MKIKVRVRKYEQFGRLAHRFRDAANGDLQRDAVNELHTASHPVLGNVRHSVLRASFPAIADRARRPSGEGLSWRLSPEPESTGLRARLAAATHVTPLPQGNGVRFFVEGTQVDPRWGRRLSKLTDVTLAPRWRHPTFDDLPWVTQYGRPWFFSSIRPARPTFEAGIHRAMARTARKITGGK